MFFAALYSHSLFVFFFFFNDTATTEIYPLSLHDALPIYLLDLGLLAGALAELEQLDIARTGHAVLVDGFFLFWHGDRKSTRLNSSHLVISYAVFCLKKKKENQSRRRR